MNFPISAAALLGLDNDATEGLAFCTVGSVPAVVSTRVRTADIEVFTKKLLASDRLQANSPEHVRCENGVGSLRGGGQAPVRRMAQRKGTLFLGAYCTQQDSS